ncbi:MAG: ABC transporter ATP-binding protein [Deltaproteobacteria bacterium]|nr:ABC transporter ATP-binding protein [Deltaproteobacteria bacterium]
MSDLITVSRLCRSFGSFQAVKDVSFKVGRGEIFGYLGANGAGKSTTIRMLCGLLQPTSGSAVVAGADVARDPEGVKRRIGYMSQKFSLYPDLTVFENLDFFGGAYGLSGRALRSRIDEVLDELGLRDRSRSLTSSLPGGARQRVALANALLHNPDVLFLDEPTAGVDPASRRDFIALVRRRVAQGTTAFLTTHYMDEAEYCDRVGLMVAGCLKVLDTPSALKANHVPGALFEVRTARRGDVTAALNAIQGLATIQRIGAGLRVRYDPSPGRDRVAESALAADPDAVVEAAEASLDDVFRAVVDQEAQ